MNSNELNFYCSTTDLDEIESINQKRILAFINHWVYNTAQFLNKLTYSCQDRLIKLENKLSKASDDLAILEAKLNSVPGLENVSKSTLSVNLPDNENVETKIDEQTKAAEPVESVLPETESEDIPSKNTVVAREHPQYKTYFKMVTVGVPREAVKIKMVSIELDPTVLDDPSALIKIE